MITDFDPKRAVLVSISLLLLVVLSIAQTAIKRIDVRYVKCDDTGFIFAMTSTGMAYVGKNVSLPVPVSKGCGFTYFEDPRTGFRFAEFNGDIAKVPSVSGATQSDGNSAADNLKNQFGNFLK